MKEVLIDSSVLIDFFEEKLDANNEKFLESMNACISMLSYYEVCKFFYKIGKTKELEFVKQRLKLFNLIEVNFLICDEAAKYSHSLGLSLADSIIYASARVNNLELLTSDADLKGKKGVIFVK